MDPWMNKVFGFRDGDVKIRRPDATDFDLTLTAARQLSMHPENRDNTVVVVELGSDFDVRTGTYVRNRYNFYTHRGAGDFNAIYNLKAAYLNGRRVDTINNTNSSRLVVHRSPVTTPTSLKLNDVIPSYVASGRLN
ncbi:MAG: hypothetical protein ACLQVD_17455 [Capsulimonadaceae bacterium]